jgi:hypothetical protein
MIYARKTTPGVKAGRVQRKNNWNSTPNPYLVMPEVPMVVRERPGRDYRHVVRQRDIIDFLHILPDWEQVVRGLRSVILAPGRLGYDGLYLGEGVIKLSAWPRELWCEWERDYHRAHAAVLDRLGVPVRALEDDLFECQFTDETARGFMLLHVFLHELGHHRDRMSTASERESARGESWAESYAISLENDPMVWRRYTETFSL